MNKRKQQLFSKKVLLINRNSHSPPAAIFARSVASPFAFGALKDAMLYRSLTETSRPLNGTVTVLQIRS
jgi:hypothetical protein